MTPPELVIFALAAFGLGFAALVWIAIARGILRSRAQVTRRRCMCTAKEPLPAPGVSHGKSRT